MKHGSYEQADALMSGGRGLPRVDSDRDPSGGERRGRASSALETVIEIARLVGDERAVDAAAATNPVPPGATLMEGAGR